MAVDARVKSSPIKEDRVVITYGTTNEGLPFVSAIKAVDQDQAQLYTQDGSASKQMVVLRRGMTFTLTFEFDDKVK